MTRLFFIVSLLLLLFSCKKDDISGSAAPPDNPSPLDTATVLFEFIEGMDTIEANIISTSITLFPPEIRFGGSSFLGRSAYIGVLPTSQAGSYQVNSTTQDIDFQYIRDTTQYRCSSCLLEIFEHDQIEGYLDMEITGTAIGVFTFQSIDIGKVRARNYYQD